MPGFGLDLNSCFVNSSVWVSIDPFRLSRYDQDLDWGGGLKVVIIIGCLKLKNVRFSKEEMKKSLLISEMNNIVYQKDQTLLTKNFKISLKN